MPCATGPHIDFLVNNAGYGVTGSYVNVAWSDHQRFIQMMMTAVCDLHLPLCCCL